MGVEQLALDMAKVLAELEHLKVGFSNHLSQHWAITIGLIAVCVPMAFTVAVMLMRRLVNGKK